MTTDSKRISPLQTVELLTRISALNFVDLASTGEAHFWDTTPDTLIAYAEGDDAKALADLVGMPVPAENGLAILIGGDSLQVEFHGRSENGEPVDWALPIVPLPKGEL